MISQDTWRARLAALVLTGWLAAACGSAPVPSRQVPTATPGPTATLAPSSVTPRVNPARAPTSLAAATPVTPLPPPSATPAAPAYDWLQFNGDPQHSGNNAQEQAPTASNVSRLQRAFKVGLPSVADGAPVFLHGVPTGNGLTDLLFITTKAGDILAVDAHSGSLVWQHQVPAGSCRINNFLLACYTTSSPAIDPGRQYVYSYGLDGRVHKYQVGDGREILDGGWPEVVTLKPYDEKGSSALAIATARSGSSYLYVVTSGYFGDQGDYQGHLVAINLADGSQRVFNVLCSDQAVHLADQRITASTDCSQVQAGIWARAGVVYSPETDKIYLATGNGAFDPAHHHWGDTVFALRPDGTGASGDPLDSYTPATFARLQQFDVDLGSTAPALLPPVAGSAFPHLAVQGGKDATLRLLNLDDLSGQGGPGHTGGEVFSLPVPMGGQVLTAPAVWTDPADSSPWVFVANGHGMAGLRVTLDSNTGVPRLAPAWQTPDGGTSPIVANGVLYYAGSGHLWALAPKTGQVLWSSAQVGPIHWESPIVAGGTLYLTDESGSLAGFSLIP
jgi:outer membrane protein assembly factor BamB